MREHDSTLLAKWKRLTSEQSTVEMSKDSVCSQLKRLCVLALTHTARSHVVNMEAPGLEKRAGNDNI